jgi:hypothetical protein
VTASTLENSSNNYPTHGTINETSDPPTAALPTDYVIPPTSGKSRQTPSELAKTDKVEGTTSEQGRDDMTLSQSPALARAIADHNATLPTAVRARFVSASVSLKDESLLGEVKKYNQVHEEESFLRKHTEKLESTLGVLSRFTAIVAVATGSNAEATIALGAIRIVLDLALGFLGFFSKLTQMLNRFTDFLGPLNAYASAPNLHSQQLLQDCLAATYGDLLRFCQKAYSVFYDEKSGKKRSMPVVRTFLRLQWVPFEAEFGAIEIDLKHHLHVLSLASDALEAPLITEIHDHQQGMFIEEVFTG